MQINERTKLDGLMRELTVSPNKVANVTKFIEQEKDPQSVPNFLRIRRALNLSDEMVQEIRDYRETVAGILIKRGTEIESWVRECQSNPNQSAQLRTIEFYVWASEHQSSLVRSRVFSSFKNPFPLLDCNSYLLSIFKRLKSLLTIAYCR